jgi:hypothetical protein
MGIPLFTNNAATYLAFGITNTATTMQVSSNAGNLFPNPTGTDYFYLSLISLSGPTIEIVKCTARSGDIFTIVRGQDGTSPQYWNAGDNVQLRITAASLNLFASESTAEQDLAAYKAAVASSTGSSLVGYSQSGSNTVTTTVQAELQKTFRTSDYTTFSQALTSANNNTLIVDSTIAITSNTTIPSTVQLIVNNGALFTVNTGVVLTINGALNASPYKIFNCVGTGNVKIGPETPIVYAEWWGTTNDNSSDDAIAIQAACNSLSPAGGIVQLLNKHYYAKTNIKVTTQCLTIQGTTTGLSPYDNGSGGPQGTQIVGTNGTNCLWVYNVAYFTMNNVEMYLATGATTACVGLLLDSCFLAKINDCRINNFSTALHMVVCTDIYITRCYLASLGSTVSPVIGIDIDGSTTQNASVFLQQCIAAHSTYSATAYGYYLHGNRINDLYMDTCEADGCTSGFIINGSAVNAGYGADIHLRGCSADGCTVGFEIDQLAVDSACEIINGWSASSTIGVFVGYSSARVRVSGMQIYGAANGVIAQDSSQVIILDNFFLYQGSHSVYVNNCPSSIVTNNQGYQKTTSGCTFISFVGTSTFCSVANNVANATITNAWVAGITAATGCDYLSVVGNSITSAGAVTTPYTLNLATNTHTYFAGTGIPN